MKKILIVLAVALLLVPSIAGAMEKEKVNLAIDCHTQHAYRSITVPEGKKATRFQASYEEGQECGLEELTKALTDPDTSSAEAKELRKKWDNRMPPPYGWGIMSTKGERGYFYRVFHQHRVKSLTTGNLGSLWLGPGKYTIELRGYRKDSTLSLSFSLEPYTPEEGKKPAAVGAAPAVTGMVEKPHAPGASAATAEQKVGPGIWGGVWYTHPGTITLTQNDNHISGHYTLQNGKINGKIVGNTLVGNWSDGPTYKPPMDAGEADYKMAPDGKSFTVDFRGGYAKDNLPRFRNAWKATRNP